MNDDPPVNQPPSGDPAAGDPAAGDSAASNPAANDAAGPDATTQIAGARRDLPRVPGYELTRVLGEGGMASVFLATDARLKRQVAIKTMSAKLSADPQFRLRFTDEARTVAALRHPNVVTVFASGEADEQLYIVMEYVPGGTLADRLTSGPLSLPVALDIARGLLRALTHLHAQDIVHRDLKPGNVLFTPTGEPVLSDFGIAKALDADSSRTMVGSVIGSPKYMAPEQLLGNPVTDRADIYSLGLVLLEMLTCEVPPRDVTSIRNSKDVENLRRRLPAAARPATTLLAQCLRVEPGERPTSSEALVSVDALAQRIRSRRRWAIPAGAAAVAVLTVYSVWIVGRAPPDPAPKTAPPIVAPVTAPVDAGIIEPLSAKTASADVQAAAPSLPDLTEFSEFSTAFNVDGPRTRRIPDFNYPPYKKLMAMLVVWLEGGPAAVADDIAELRSAAQRGDPVARLSLFLAADAKLIDDSPRDLVSGVKAASDEGYALATYYYALFFRTQHETDGVLDNPQSLVELRDLYALAVEQGLKFAKLPLNEANQVLTSTATP